MIPPNTNLFEMNSSLLVSSHSLISNWNSCPSDLLSLIGTFFHDKKCIFDSMQINKHWSSLFRSNGFWQLYPGTMYLDRCPCDHHNNIKEEEESQPTLYSVPDFVFHSKHWSIACPADDGQCDFCYNIFKRIYPGLQSLDISATLLTQHHSLLFVPYLSTLRELTVRNWDGKCQPCFSKQESSQYMTFPEMHSLYVCGDMDSAQSKWIDWFLKGMWNLKTLIFYEKIYNLPDEDKLMLLQAISELRHLKELEVSIYISVLDANTEQQLREQLMLVPVEKFTVDIRTAMGKLMLSCFYSTLIDCNLDEHVDDSDYLGFVGLCKEMITWNPTIQFQSVRMLTSRIQLDPDNNELNLSCLEASMRRFPNVRKLHMGICAPEMKSEMRLLEMISNQWYNSLRRLKFQFEQWYEADMTVTDWMHYTLATLPVLFRFQNLKRCVFDFSDRYPLTPLCQNAFDHFADAHSTTLNYFHANTRPKYLYR